METERGIIIRLTKLTDTSLIVHWITRKFGLLKTVAKGARRPKNPFAGRLDLFLEADFEWTRSRTSDLHYLREISVVDYRLAIRSDYQKAVLASYFGQVLEFVLEPEHDDPEIFDLLQRGLGYLAEQVADLRAMKHYERELARILGLGSDGFHSLARQYENFPVSRNHCLALLEKK